MAASKSPFVAFPKIAAKSKPTPLAFLYSVVLPEIKLFKFSCASCNDKPLCFISPSIASFAANPAAMRALSRNE